MRGHRNFVWRCLIPCFCLLGLAPATRADVTIAVVGPMTGASSSAGLSFKDGASLAADRINGGGGLLGQRLSVSVFDDACDADRAVAAANAAIAARPALIVGHSCSAASIGAAPLYAKAATVQISPNSTNPKLTELGIPTVFRMIGRDDRQGEAAARLIAARWPKRQIAILDDGQVYGKELAQSVRAGLAARHIPVAFSATFVPNAASYADLVARLKERSIDLLYLGGYSLDVGLILRQIAAAGLSIQCLTGDAAADSSILDIAGPAIRWLAFTSPPNPAQNPAAAPVMAAGRAKRIDLAAPDQFMLAYASVEVWAATVNQIHSFDTAEVAATLHSAAFKTVLGPVSFDAKGDITGPAANWAWYRWSNGKTEPFAP